MCYELVSRVAVLNFDAALRIVYIYYSYITNILLYI